MISWIPRLAMEFVYESALVLFLAILNWKDTARVKAIYCCFGKPFIAVPTVEQHGANPAQAAVSAETMQTDFSSIKLL